MNHLKVSTTPGVPVMPHHDTRASYTRERGPERVSWGAASKGEDAELLIVPIPNVCNCTLKKVLDFCEQQRAFDDLVRASPAAQQPEVTRKTQAWRETYMKVHPSCSGHRVLASRHAGAACALPCVGFLA